MEISKKDLLQETKISYGQLYRWKREGLIPEAWFIKRSSFTGQETYFPKEQILNRIHAIQQLKDKYSLEELANMLSPEVSMRIFSEEDLEEFEEIDIELAASFMDEMEKDNFIFVEVLVMMALSECKREFSLSQESVSLIVKGLAQVLRDIQTIDYMVLLINIDNVYYVNVMNDAAQLFLDSRMHIVKKIRLQDLSNAMKLKYKDTFKFEFDGV